MMTIPRLVLASVCIALAPLVNSCGEETVEERVNRRLQETISESVGADVDLDSLGEALRRMTERIDLDSLEVSGLDDVEVIPFRELKALMPDRIGGLLDGLPRQRDGGETRKVLGLRYSVAEAVYEEDGRRVEASLTDAGGGGSVLKSLVGFSGFEIDKEDAEGSERTFELDGHKAYEKARTRGGDKRTQLTVLVNDRFVVSLKGTGVEAALLTKAFRDFDLGALPVEETE